LRRSKMKQLTKDASKQDEINWLEEVASNVGEGTYLKSLFSEKFIGWATQKIKDDWSLDLMDEYYSSMNQSSALSAKLIKVTDDYEKDVKRYEEKAKEFANTITKMNEHERGLQEKIQSLSRDCSKLRREKALLIPEYDRWVKELTDEVTRLKVRLYDLLEKE
jgi:predicted RNase H-like nuclease (RuvC/YqgF family)